MRRRRLECVCKNAVEAIGRVVATAPQHAGEVLPTLAKGRVDDSWSVREIAFEAIDHVVTAAPQHVCEHLPTLAKGCVDDDPDVRNAARKALNGIDYEKVVTTVMSILPVYYAGLLFLFVKDSFTLDSLAKLKTASFVSHTFSSLEIRKWSKDDIDHVVGFVRRDFDEKWSRLLRAS